MKKEVEKISADSMSIDITRQNKDIGFIFILKLFLLVFEGHENFYCIGFCVYLFFSNSRSSKSIIFIIWINDVLRTTVIDLTVIKKQFFLPYQRCFWVQFQAVHF
ncbi:hypothetical protein ABG775_10450 [Peribacillus simplex]|uniref:hypothetical protein n=1 Tax=Peribacillus simplex TaxID=1478 RepID=UPI0033965D8E